jgi:hypothetical protein
MATASTERSAEKSQVPVANRRVDAPQVLDAYGAGKPAGIRSDACAG